MKATSSDVIGHLADILDLNNAIVALSEAVEASPANPPAAKSAAASIAALARRIDGHLEALAEIEDRRQ